MITQFHKQKPHGRSCVATIQNNGENMARSFTRITHCLSAHLAMQRIQANVEHRKP